MAVKVKFSMTAIMRAVGTKGLNNSELTIGDATLKLESESDFTDDEGLPVSYTFKKTEKVDGDIVVSFVSIPANSLLGAYVKVPKALALKAGDKGIEFELGNKKVKGIGMPAYLNRYLSGDSGELSDLEKGQDFFDEFETAGTIPVMETNARYKKALEEAGVPEEKMFRFPLRAYQAYEDKIADMEPDEDGRYPLKMADYGEIYSTAELTPEFDRAPEFANKRLVIKMKK